VISLIRFDSDQFIGTPPPPAGHLLYLHWASTAMYYKISRTFDHVLMVYNRFCSTKPFSPTQLRRGECGPEACFTTNRVSRPTGFSSEYKRLSLALTLPYVSHSPCAKCSSSRRRRRHAAIRSFESPTSESTPTTGASHGADSEEREIHHRRRR
jgi:hypothetical protein